MKRIGVFGVPPSSGLFRVLDAVAYDQSVVFEACLSEDFRGFDGVILINGSRNGADAAISSGVSCYAQLSDEVDGGAMVGSSVEFRGSEEVPGPFRSKAITMGEFLEVRALRPRTDENVIATIDGKPVWLQRTDSTIRLTLVGFRLPACENGTLPFQYFKKENFVNLLPLIEFVRHVAEYRTWTRPPLRACLMFDDPNLQWRSYGRINYGELATHARKHKYHVAIATIPLDAWYVDKTAARLFRENRTRLSLLVHGNNHTKRELACVQTFDERILLLKQALRRMELLERRGSVDVCRVMAPPHGACCEDMIAAMKHCGFEAACISHGSLAAHNSGSTWLGRMGFGITNNIRGFPVMSRFRISATCENEILMAAYLDRPIIPVGHHADASDGMKLLERTADIVNSLGDVWWTNVEGLGRSNVRFRCVNGRLEVKMSSRRVSFTVPRDVETVVVSGLVDETDGEERLELRGADVETSEVRNGFEERRAICAGQRIEIVAKPKNTVATDNGRLPRTGIWPILRRQAAQLRDRMEPALAKMTQR